MACIVLETPGGTRYTWPEGKARRPIPGEKIVGVEWDCGPNTQVDELDTLLEREGIKWGSVIKYAAKKVGIKQCSRCAAREVILNEARDVGLLATLRRLKETLQ